MTQINRRSFLSRAARIGAGAASLPFLPLAGLAAASSTGSAAPVIEGRDPECDLAVARGSDPARNCLAALDALGGMGRFVKAGQKVVIKPNPVGAYPPERAINTHPDVLATVVRECARVGAREIVVISHDVPRDAQVNGVARAVEENGGLWRPVGLPEHFRPIIVPRGQLLQKVGVAVDLLEADVFINVPIVKHHAGSQVTFSMKNLMGVIWDRLALHNAGLQRGIAEVASAIRQDLVILDANYCLLTNGPVGPGRVANLKQVIAGTDPVAIDAYAARFLELKPQAIEQIRAAYDLGVGEMNLDLVRVREFDA